MILSKKCKIAFSLCIFLIMVFSVFGIAEDPENGINEPISSEEPIEEQPAPSEEEPIEEETPQEPAEEEQPIEEVTNTSEKNQINEEPIQNESTDDTVIIMPINETEPTNNLPINETISNDTVTIMPVNDTVETPVNDTEPINNSDPINDPPVDEIPPEEPGLLKTVLNLILDKISAIKGEIVNLKAKLTYENNSPAINQPIDFFANEEQIGTETTDDSGLAEVKWDTSSVGVGVYLINASYKGNNILEGSFDVVEVVVEEEINNTIPDNSTDEILENTTQVNETPTNKTIAIIFNESVSRVEKIKDCKETGKMKKIWGNCKVNITESYCDDEPINKSCRKIIKEIDRECVIGTEPIQHCITKELIVDNSVKIKTENYKCSIEEGNQVILICDSKYDGNGDGKCTSGESCMKFVVNGNNVKKYEKNSRDDFIEIDESFFLERASAEVLK